MQLMGPMRLMGLMGLTTVLQWEGAACPRTWATPSLTDWCPLKPTTRVDSGAAFNPHEGRGPPSSEPGNHVPGVNRVSPTAAKLHPSSPA